MALPYVLYLTGDTNEYFLQLNLLKIKTSRKLSAQKMEEDANSSAKPTLLSLPVELRLKIYNFAKSPRTPLEIQIGYRTYLIPCSVCDIGLSLIQTCRKVKDEVIDVLYKNRRFEIVSGCRRRLGPGRRSLTDSSLLSKIQVVHMIFNILHTVERVHNQSVALQGFLQSLMESKELKVFTFSAHCILMGIGSIGGKIIQKKFYELRRASTEEGVKDGKDAKERELDYAMRVMSFLKLETMSK